MASVGCIKTSRSVDIRTAWERYAAAAKTGSFPKAFRLAIVQTPSIPLSNLHKSPLYNHLQGVWTTAQIVRPWSLPISTPDPSSQFSFQDESWG